ncbi:MAG: MTH895/ArsE family thioredoxin-like protein [Armatimonadota bacterium]
MRYLTISQVAERLQLSVPTVKRYIYDGKLSSTKLPGGQHRVPESEVERLLAPDEAQVGATPSSAAEAEPERRIEVLERWVTELEAETERLSAALEVVSRYCAAAAGSETVPQAAPEEPRVSIQVLGPGCQRCRALHELTVGALDELGATDVAVEHVTDLNRIVAFGPVLTPALAINGVLVLSGRVPDEAELRELLAGHLS